MTPEEPITGLTKERELAVNALVSEYQALGSAIRDYMLSSVQLSAASVGVAALIAAASFAHGLRGAILVLPILWSVFGLVSARLYREVLAMGASRADIERRLARDFGDIDIQLRWETIVVATTLHRRSASWAENGAFIVVYALAIAAAMRVAWDLDTSAQELGLYGFKWIYAAGTAVLFLLLVWSVKRTTGIARRVTEQLQEDGAPN